MLVKVLGAIDIVAGASLVLLAINSFLPTSFLVLLGMVVFAKSLLGLFQDFGGWIDLATALVLIISGFFLLPKIILFIFAILILQKGIVSYI